MKTKKSQIGNIIKIQLGENYFGFGRIVEGDFIEFYDVKLTRDELNNVSESLAKARVIFTLSVHKSWEKKENWEVTGSNTNNISPIPSQFMQNIANPNDIKIVDSSGNMRQASIDDITGLERLAVWEDNHVEDRLRDYFDNKPNVWVEQLKPKRPG